ncbi:hypothetical protein ABC345_07460 [Shouchella sp. 1P09AA]|uniref:hypothetical protein n=1 Tax=Bacillaceae TaxID=186817 RepID=UPI00159BD949|nr:MULTISPECIES: hypothetical protein [Bacillaceae]UTR07858.1 hypothetical protein MM326_07540 [Alkalihalobacillus sp. LMS6]
MRVHGKQEHQKALQDSIDRIQLNDANTIFSRLECGTAPNDIIFIKKALSRN